MHVVCVCVCRPHLQRTSQGTLIVAPFSFSFYLFYVLGFQIKFPLKKKKKRERDDLSSLSEVTLANRGCGGQVARWPDPVPSPTEASRVEYLTDVTPTPSPTSAAVP